MIASPVGTGLSRGLGCNALGHIDSARARCMLFNALNHGVDVFDTAASYAGGRSEEELGRWLPRGRATFRIVTKFGHPSSVPAGVGPAAPAQAERALDASLRRLRRDRIDIWLIHFPDSLTPLADILGFIDGAMRSGKVGAYGVSNHSVPQLRALLAQASAMAMAPPILVQAEYNLLNRAAETDLLPLLAEQRIAFCPFFPLAGGLLTGKYDADAPIAGPLRQKAVNRFADRFFTDQALSQLRELSWFCVRNGVSLPHFALQWLATRPGVACPLVGASTPQQVGENCRWLDASLPAEMLDAVPHCLVPLAQS